MKRVMRVIPMTTVAPAGRTIAMTTTRALARPARSRTIATMTRALALIPALLLSLAGCASRSPAHENQRFVPVTRSMQDWGALDFNNRQLQFEALQGEMKLEYVGAFPESAGEVLAGAAVYRIKNADQYFQKNRSMPSFCSAPARFAAMNSTTGAPAWSSEIWLALLTVEDWKSYEPSTGGSCGGGKYVRAAAE